MLTENVCFVLVGAQHAAPLLGKIDHSVEVPT